MPGCRTIVSSMSNGAGLSTSLIAVSSAGAPSALVWKVIPLSMEIIFNVECDVIDFKYFLKRREMMEDGDRETNDHATKQPFLLMRRKARLFTIDILSQIKSLLPQPLSLIVPLTSVVHLWAYLGRHKIQKIQIFW